MSERITRRHLEFRIEWLSNALGRPAMKWTPSVNGKGSTCPVGAFYLEKGCNGWQIEETINEQGCSAQPFGHQRMTARETLNVLDAALAGIEMARKGGVK